MAGVGRATAARWGRHDLQTGKPALELERLGQAAKVEAHEAIIENSRRGFAGIKQDRIYRESEFRWRLSRRPHRRGSRSRSSSMPIQSKSGQPPNRQSFGVGRAAARNPERLDLERGPGAE